LNWYQFKVKDRNLISIFCSICWRGYLSFNAHFWHLCQKSDGCCCMGLCHGLPLYFIGFCVYFCARTMLFLSLCMCRIAWRKVLWYLQCCFFDWGLLWLFKVFCASKWNLRLTSFHLGGIGILIRIALNIYIAFSSIVILIILTAYFWARDVLPSSDVLLK
jgi:hypothetical protein